MEVVYKMFRDGVDLETICETIAALAARGNPLAYTLIMELAEAKRE